MSRQILPLDELNVLKSLTARQNSNATTEQIVKQIIDGLEIMFAYGYADVSMSLEAGTSYDAELSEKAVSKAVGGKTAATRLTEYIDAGDIDSANRVIDVESHRLYNEGAFASAVANGATQKTWHTMGDENVRDSHWFMDGMTVPIDADFYSGDGNATQYPGQFGIAEEDINCRCWCTYSN